MHVLVLGAYGLIGQEIVRALLTAGHQVAGLGRTSSPARLRRPGLSWHNADMSELTTAAGWLPHLNGIDAVVNAAGALQSGPRDDLAAVQRDAIAALIAACAQKGIKPYVQISAPGATPGADTEFLSTKGEADDALRASTLDWVILRPGLVIAPTAHGGTSLIRALAAFPIVQPLVLADASMQTVHVADVARATVRALSDPALKHQTFDLGEAQPHTLAQIVAAFRGWLGFAPVSRAVPVPRFIGNAIGKLADIAGLLGWRAPLRTTALRVLADGVLLDPEPWRKATGETLRSLDDTLRDLPATRQERSFARIELIFPVLVAVFALFWIVSGVIGLIEREAAARIVEGALGPMPARAAVIAGSLADIAIGAFMLRRKTFRSACTAAALLSFGYFVLGTLITPQLWSDPLGPLLKIAPIIGCALMLASYAEER